MHQHNSERQHNSHEPAGEPRSDHRPLHVELVEHLPFSVSAAAIGLVVAGIICFLTPAERGSTSPADAGPPASMEDRSHAHEDSADHDLAGRDRPRIHNPFQDLFHLFHPVHMLFSAAATTAMFWRYERRLLKAIVIGMVGAIGICGLSDIVMPQIALTLLGKSSPWHICVVEHPSMVLSFAAAGVLVALAASRSVVRSTFFSHPVHVFVSTMASIFYLIGPFGRLGWIDSIGTIFLFIIVAVMVPCCVSDIVFPLLFLARSTRERFRHEHVCGG